MGDDKPTKNQHHDLRNEIWHNSGRFPMIKPFKPLPGLRSLPIVQQLVAQPVVHARTNAHPLIRNERSRAPASLITRRPETAVTLLPNAHRAQRA
jgi:hypothetical protein